MVTVYFEQEQPRARQAHARACVNAPNLVMNFFGNDVSYYTHAHAVTKVAPANKASIYTVLSIYLSICMTALVRRRRNCQALTALTGKYCRQAGTGDVGWFFFFLVFAFPLTT